MCVPTTYLVRIINNMINNDIIFKWYDFRLAYDQSWFCTPECCFVPRWNSALGGTRQLSNPSPRRAEQSTEHAIAMYCYDDTEKIDHAKRLAKRLTTQNCNIDMPHARYGPTAGVGIWQAKFLRIPNSQIDAGREFGIRRNFASALWPADLWI